MPKTTDCNSIALYLNSNCEEFSVFFSETEDF